MINSEHDLWQLFGGEGPNTPGKKELSFNEFHDLTTVMDVGSKDRRKTLRPRVKTTEPGRYYYRLRCPDAEAVVDQARLFVTASKIGSADLQVAYLGTSPQVAIPE